MRMRGLVASLALASLCSAALADDAATRTGAAAYGDWRTDAPGVRRLITPADMPALGASPSTSNASRLVARPAGAWPKAPPGFVVSEFASGFKQPRVLRVAPNGDIFVAESGGGRVSVLTAADGAAKAARTQVFAAGLNRPYGVAFYPPGPDPHYVYVAATDKVVRYPYKAGDPTRLGAGRDRRASLPGRPATGPATSPSRPTARRCSSRSARAPTLPKTCRRCPRASLRRSWRATRWARPGARRRIAPTCWPSIPTGATCASSRPEFAIARAWRCNRKPRRCGAPSTSATCSATTCRPTT